LTCYKTVTVENNISVDIRNGRFILCISSTSIFVVTDALKFKNMNADEKLRLAQTRKTK
jgi:hypothetical protein